jgi:hypothetical protein
VALDTSTSFQGVAPVQFPHTRVTNNVPLPGIRSPKPSTGCGANLRRCAAVLIMLLLSSQPE